jgi:hypothetical protein
MASPNFSKLKQAPGAGTKSVATATLAFAGSQKPDAIVPKIAEQEIFLDAIRERDENTFKMTNIDSLADSIYDYGLIEPITVWKTEKDPHEKYTISAGHRRFKAFQTLHERYPNDERFAAIPARAYIVTDNPDLLAQGGKYISVEQENGMYIDSNFETRQITYSDALTYIDYLIERIEKNAKDEIKAIEMQEANRDSIQRHSHRVNKSEFISSMIAEQHYDSWSPAMCRKYLFLRDKAKEDTSAQTLMSRIHLPEDNPERISVSTAYTEYNGAKKDKSTRVKALTKKVDDIAEEVANGRLLTAYEKKVLAEAVAKLEQLINAE